MNVIWSKLGWKGDYSRARPLCFANQWIVQDIPSLSSQSECAKMDIHCFGIYTQTCYLLLFRYHCRHRTLVCYLYLSVSHDLSACLFVYLFTSQLSIIYLTIKLASSYCFALLVILILEKRSSHFQRFWNDTNIN